jgi:hypothetical protein
MVRDPEGDLCEISDARDVALLPLGRRWSEGPDEGVFICGGQVPLTSSAE